MNRTNPTWSPFESKEGDTYTFEHLEPFGFKVVKEASNQKPQREYPCWVTFSCHCFTREPREGEAVTASCFYPAPKNEKRIFCKERYGLSFRLKGMIERHLSKGKTKCFQTKVGNFFILESTDSEGKSVNYEVYFRPYKSDTHTRTVNIYIVSAYPRISTSPYTPRKRNPKMSIEVIAYNTLHNKPLKNTPR